MELESIMLSEVSQAVKDEYCMILPRSVTRSTKQTNEQNRTRNLEVRNKLTVTKGLGEGNNRGTMGKDKQKNTNRGLIRTDSGRN